MKQTRNKEDAALCAVLCNFLSNYFFKLHQPFQPDQPLKRLLHTVRYGFLERRKNNFNYILCQKLGQNWAQFGRDDNEQLVFYRGFGQQAAQA